MTPTQDAGAPRNWMASRPTKLQNVENAAALVSVTTKAAPSPDASSTSTPTTPRASRAAPPPGARSLLSLNSGASLASLTPPVCRSSQLTGPLAGSGRISRQCLVYYLTFVVSFSTIRNVPGAWTLVSNTTGPVG